MKILIGTSLLLVYTRVGGRSQINPLSATDVVSSVVIGSLISESLFEDAVPAWLIALVVGLWCVAFMLVRYIKSKRIGAELLLDGRAVQLVENGRLLAHSFGAVNLSLRDFETLIHQEDVAAIAELEDVWFEPNGKLAIVKKGQPRHSVLLVENGQVYKSSLARIGKDGAWLDAELSRRGYARRDVFCAEWNKGELQVYPY